MEINEVWPDTMEMNEVWPDTMEMNEVWPDTYDEGYIYQLQPEPTHNIY